VDYAVPSATAESLARSVERMTSIIGDLTATNSQLMQDLRLRDQKISQHDLQIKAREERIVALACENKRLAGEVARLKKEKEERAADGVVGT
jgi:Wiskott-Aldrich syndrome protein